MKTPTEHESDKGDAGTDNRSDLAALDAKIRAHTEAHRQKNPEPAETGRRSTAIGMAFRLSTEMVAGLVAGGIIGWVVDDLLGTKPWGLLTFFFLGMAAGILNVFRTAHKLAADVAEQVGKSDDPSGDK
ncbi:MAG: ATP F0F1 synthase subunit I [Parvibaculum sp.]|jgi:ATP synthase protein I|nr:ATP F0F1 synthase subunit I [Parvibaculum sp.]|tara:strand:+ start:388 stop:774 length:387 start_codon:yes stop_codon:yes gene_type:complete